MWTVEPLTGLMIAIASVAVAVAVARPLADAIIDWRDRRGRRGNNRPIAPAE